MRCLSCDAALSGYEATRKYEWGEFIDLCSACYDTTDLANTIDRQDLLGVKNDGDEDELP